jgi:protein-disulfide isomerase
MGSFMSKSLLSLFIAALLMLSVTPLLAEGEEGSAALLAATPEKEAVREVIAAPDTSNILFLQNLRRIGSTIYFLGESMGLNGWLVVKDKQVQIVYTTPDQRAVVVGALLSAEGANISQQQILLLAQKKPEIATLLKLGDASAIHVSDEKARKRVLEEVRDVKGLSRAEQFFAELKKTTMLTFGKSDAPHLYMIMDVHCHFCHATWKLLEPHVDDGSLRLSMIPIGAMGMQSETDATNWINSKDPLDTWRKHVAGDKTILKIGDMDPSKSDAVNANTKFVYKWKVDQTPYLVYRGQNGKVRMVMGMPQELDALLKDLTKDDAVFPADAGPAKGDPAPDAAK